MKFLKDEENICLRCAHADPYMKGQPSGCPQIITFCLCMKPSQRGANKGYRTTCRGFELDEKYHAIAQQRIEETLDALLIE